MRWIEKNTGWWPPGRVGSTKIVVWRFLARGPGGEAVRDPLQGWGRGADGVPTNNDFKYYYCGLVHWGLMDCDWWWFGGLQYALDREKQ